MARKTGYTISFEFDDLNRQIRDAVNVAKWNPVLAIEWMNAVAVRAVSPIIIKHWNRAAKEINAFWASLPGNRWYSQKVFWGERQPEILPQLDDSYSLEDYAAMVKYESSDDSL